MKCFIVLYFLFVNSVSLCFAQKKNWDYKLWDEQSPLTWSDFNGVPDKNKPKAIASIHSRLSLITRDTLNSIIVEPRAFMRREKSWKILQNDYVLKHEETHFNITELYRRIFIKKLFKINNRYNVRKTSMLLDEIYEQVNADRNKFQDFYDNETDHPKNKSKQYYWNAEIKRRLNRLNNFNLKRVRIYYKTGIK